MLFWEHAGGVSLRGMPYEELVSTAFLRPTTTGPTAASYAT